MAERSIVIASRMAEHGETGVQTHFNSYRRYRRENGLDTTLVTPFSAPAILVYPVFAIRRLIDPLNSGASLWWYGHWHYVFLKWALRRVLQRTAEPVTVYAQSPDAARAALETRTTPQQRVVLAVHFNVSVADEWAERGTISRGGRLFTWLRNLEADVLPKLDGVVYVSEFMRARLEERVPGVRAIDSIVVPNFVAPPEPCARPSVTGDIITIGTLEPRKNQSFLLYVLAEAKRAGRRYTLTIVGDGPDRSWLKSLARQLGIVDQIRFLGFVPNASQLIPGHRVYAHSAKMESFGIVLVEAMAHGLPLLAAPVGGIPEVFSDGVEGCYWSLDDAAAAAKLLISLLDDPMRCADMHRAALRKFTTCYEMATVVPRLDDFLCQDHGDGVLSTVRKAGHLGGRR